MTFTYVGTHAYGSETVTVTATVCKTPEFDAATAFTSSSVNTVVSSGTTTYNVINTAIEDRTLTLGPNLAYGMASGCSYLGISASFSDHSSWFTWDSDALTLTLDVDVIEIADYETTIVVTFTATNVLDSVTHVETIIVRDCLYDTASQSSTAFMDDHGVLIYEWEPDYLLQSDWAIPNANCAPYYFHLEISTDLDEPVGSYSVGTTPFSSETGL